MQKLPRPSQQHSQQPTTQNVRDTTRLSRWMWRMPAIREDIAKPGMSFLTWLGRRGSRPTKSPQTPLKNLLWFGRRIPELRPVLLLRVLNHILLGDDPLEEFLLLLPIYKKGDPKSTANYRGIALMSVCCKLFNRLQLVQLHNTLKPHLRVNQNSFRPHRSCEQHITTIRRVVKGCRMYQDCQAIMLFIDFKKVFDSLWWHQMEGILGAFRVPRILIQAIMASYHGQQVKIHTPAGLTQHINLTWETLVPHSCLCGAWTTC